MEFDCYIKRYNGYVIIIEAGTKITDELYEKVKQHKHVYAHQSERERYRAYCEKNAIVEPETQLPAHDTAVEDYRRLGAILNSPMRLKEKIDRTYHISCTLMQEYFEGGTRTLPLEGLETVVHALLHLTAKHDKLESFTAVMPDEYSADAHSVNVAIFAMFLGRHLNLTVSQLEALSLAAILHDIGKNEIDKKVLDKNDVLDNDEFEMVQTHPAEGEKIARENKINDMRILEAIKYHHEKLDGTGYPEGLRGNMIPQFAQILGICDIFDALTTERTFRGKYSSYDALHLMAKEMHEKLNLNYIKTFISQLR